LSPVNGRSLDVEMLNASLGYMLRRAQLAVFADFGDTFAGIGLRPGQLAVLMVVDRNPDVTQTDVGRALGIQRANFVAVIDDLERRGLAKRTSSATDRRSKGLMLTAAGRRVLAHALELHRAHESRICRRLEPGGREQLLRLLEQLVDLD
jgi:DNA-binding MarR family transcriptional regulator